MASKVLRVAQKKAVEPLSARRKTDTNVEYLLRRLNALADDERLLNLLIHQNYLNFMSKLFFDIRKFILLFPFCKDSWLNAFK